LRKARQSLGFRNCSQYWDKVISSSVLFSTKFLTASAASWVGIKASATKAFFLSPAGNCPDVALFCSASTAAEGWSSHTTSAKFADHASGSGNLKYFNNKG